MNYILANEYLKKNYLSIELSDTYFYKEYFSTIKVYLGEMKTGIKDSGLSVYNTKDLMKSGYSIKLGYYFNNNFILSGSYALDTLREYKKTKDAKNSSSLLSLSYTY